MSVILPRNFPLLGIDIWLMHDCLIILLVSHMEMSHETCREQTKQATSSLPIWRSRRN